MSTVPSPISSSEWEGWLIIFCYANPLLSARTNMILEWAPFPNKAYKSLDWIVIYEVA